MITTVSREKSKFQDFINEQIRITEEYEKVYPITYKCIKCKDKKWHIWWENGYEYGEPCECLIREYKEKAEQIREERKN